MAKYLQKKARRVKHPLLLGMGIYAFVFLIATAVGLSWFWGYIEAYEASRPVNAIEAYVNGLTAEDICDASRELIDGIDHTVQSEEECRRVIADFMASDVSYVKKSSASTDTQTVYVLRCGTQNIGTVTITATEMDSYGFYHWKVTDDSFDMSFLVGDSVRVMVPEDYVVSCNGTVLSDAYIIESGIEYETLESFYGLYELPTMVVYQAGPVLGNAEMTVTNAGGEPVEINDDTDYDLLLSNCTEEELAGLSEFAQVFIERYVAFTGSANNSSQSNYYKLQQYVVKGSDLSARMLAALDGLSWSNSTGDELLDMTVNQCINIGGGKYLCDVTYEVRSKDKFGTTESVNNVKFIVVGTDSGYKTEYLIRY